MKEWWKMAIFHFKHSYLNWRVIPCKRRMTCVYVIFYSFFSTFFSWIWLSCFSFRFSQIFQVHDMTIIFFFVFFLLFSFSRSHGLFTSSNNAYHRWPFRLEHLFSCEDRLVKLAFWSKVVYIVSVQREDYGSKVFSRNGWFLVNMPQGINQGDFRISRS